MTDKLLPCPFCGSEPRRWVEQLDERFAYATKLTLYCPGCGTSQTTTGDTTKPGYADNSTVEKRALNKWNSRAPIKENEHE